MLTHDQEAKARELANRRGITLPPEIEARDLEVLAESIRAAAADAERKAWRLHCEESRARQILHEAFESSL